MKAKEFYLRYGFVGTRKERDQYYKDFVLPGMWLWVGESK